MFTTSYVPKHLAPKQSLLLMLLLSFQRYTPKHALVVEPKWKTFLAQKVLLVINILNSFKQDVVAWFTPRLLAIKENRDFLVKLGYAFVIIAIPLTILFAYVPTFAATVSDEICFDEVIDDSEELPYSSDSIEEEESSDFVKQKEIENIGAGIAEEVSQPIAIEENTEQPEEEPTTETLAEETAEPVTIAGIEIDGVLYSTSPVLYLHVKTGSLDPIEVVAEPISSDDIAVDMSNPFDDNFVYDISKELKKAISRLTYAESGNQPFDGQVFVAEDIRNSLFSGIYGSDLNATCKKQYFTSLKIYDNGTVHLFRDGVELTQSSDSTDAAAALAVKGINLTARLLEAVAAVRNEQYPHWNLDDSYYAKGAIFHYAPKYLSTKQLAARKIGMVPVSFQLKDHVFYSKWLNAKYALSLT